MKPVYLLFLLTYAAAQYGYGSQQPSSSKETAQGSSSLYCLPCVVFATLLQFYAHTAATVPSALQPIAKDIQQVANASSSFLGQSIKQTASGLGNMITGTSDIAARAAGFIPFLGGYFENMIGGTGRYFGSMSEALGSGIGNMLDGSASSQMGTRRRKRSALLSPEQEAKQYLDKFDIHLPPGASEIAKGFQSLAEEIKQKTLKAVREKDEKERRDRPL